MLLFYFLALVVIWLGILSLISGMRFSKYVKSETAKASPPFSPYVSIVAPFRGLEDGLKENLLALFHQDYPQYEIILVTDSAEDPALELVRELIDLERPPSISKAQVAIAGKAIDSGQKVHNLMIAVDLADHDSEVFVFVDTDARPGSDWLRSLVAPLADQGLAAATGYRWFVPKQGGFASVMRSVWNASIASALGPDKRKNFCWGGSTAIRRTTFAQLEIANHWHGTVSDDFTVTRVLKNAGLPIRFVPRCLVPSVSDCDLRELIEFTNRQVKITRVYAEHLWKPLLAGSLLFCVVFFGGILLLLVRAWLHLPTLLLLAALLVTYALGTAKSMIRFQAVKLLLSHHRTELSRTLWAHVLLWPVASLLYLFNALVAGFSRTIQWRGITYKLNSPDEAVIIARDE